MSNRLFASLTLSAVSIAAVVAVAGAQDTNQPPVADKKVLVELYTSQGCSSCPAAEKLVGRLAELGYGPDRIVPIAFHVDYFNDPWKDPFSDQLFSRRQWAYNDVQKRKDLYFTPMMMVDGREPMLGSDRAKALPAIERALSEPPGVTLKLVLAGADRRRQLTVRLGASSTGVVGRDLLVGVATVESPITTDVTSGENAGKTLVEHHAVRAFASKLTRLGRAGSRSLTFPLKTDADWVAEHCRVAVFVQDQDSGIVYQADSLPWTKLDGSKTANQLSPPVSQSRFSTP